MAKSRKSVAIAGLVVLAGLAVASCTNRPLSLMDTYPFSGNTHPYLVQKDGKVEYSDSSIWQTTSDLGSP